MFLPLHNLTYLFYKDGRLRLPRTYSVARLMFVVFDKIKSIIELSCFSLDFHCSINNCVNTVSCGFLSSGISWDRYWLIACVGV